jgi:hypothetical protein
MESGGWTEDEAAFPSATASIERSPSPLSSRAKPTCPGVPWRDLQFCGPFLDMFFDSGALRSGAKAQSPTQGKQSLGVDFIRIDTVEDIPRNDPHRADEEAQQAAHQ